MDPLIRLARSLTSKRRAARSPAAWLASLSANEREAFLDSLTPETLAALPSLFEFWAWTRYQLPPPGVWGTWLLLGGRGSGKTRAGAEWIRRQVEGATPLQRGSAARVALVGETWEQARDVMVDGPSGLLACSPADRRPRWAAARRRLIWPNGAEAVVLSAVDPESLRGPQFDAAWCDELAKWRRGGEAWDNLQLGLRLGPAPKAVVTTTPRRNALLRRILAQPTTAVTRAKTSANAAFLSPGFVEQAEATYGDTALGRQELGGELIDDPPGALFRRSWIEAGRTTECPPLDRVVIGVDPPATGRATSDECGIVAVGRAGDILYVLGDYSIGAAAPSAWAARVIEAWRRMSADRIVAEVNQGGDMVVETLRSADRRAPVAAVRATSGKTLRAEPVSLLYERGLVRHVGALPTLEDQLCGFGTDSASPDRVDALVWAAAELTGGAGGQPHIGLL